MALIFQLRPTKAGNEKPGTWQVFTTASWSGKIPHIQSVIFISIKAVMIYYNAKPVGSNLRLNKYVFLCPFLFSYLHSSRLSGRINKVHTSVQRNVLNPEKGGVLEGKK